MEKNIANTNLSIKENKAQAITRRIGLFLEKNSVLIACVMMTAIMMCGMVFAGEDGDVVGGPNAETLWDTIATLIEKWVSRFGGVVMFVGGVMFGAGWMSDDGARKTQGVSVFTAGAIILAVAKLAPTFFA